MRRIKALFALGGHSAQRSRHFTAKAIGVRIINYVLQSLLDWRARYQAFFHKEVCSERPQNSLSSGKLLKVVNLFGYQFSIVVVAPKVGHSNAPSPNAIHNPKFCDNIGKHGGAFSDDFTFVISEAYRSYLAGLAQGHSPENLKSINAINARHATMLRFPASAQRGVE